MNTISVTNLVQIKATEGVHGRFLTWADTSHVYVNIILNYIPKTPVKVQLLLPWGAIYGRAKKYKTDPNVGLDKPAKVLFEEADPNLLNTKKGGEKR